MPVFKSNEELLRENAQLQRQVLLRQKQELEEAQRERRSRNVRATVDDAAGTAALLIALTRERGPLLLVGLAVAVGGAAALLHWANGQVADEQATLHAAHAKRVSWCAKYLSEAEPYYCANDQTFKDHCDQEPNSEACLGPPAAQDPPSLSTGAAPQTTGAPTAAASARAARMAEPTIAVAATPQVGPADRPGYVLVSLPELGTQVRVPASLAAKQEPNRVTSEDGTTSLSLQLLAEDTALKNLLLQLSRSRDVTYQRKSDNWVVLSGHAGSDIFYDKVIVSGARRLAMSVQYPEAVRTLYDGELAAIASSFRAMKPAPR